jgi:hypothetical protein
MCVRLFCVCVDLCVGSDIATGWSPVQGVLPSMQKILWNWRRGQGPTKALEPLVNELMKAKIATTRYVLSMCLTETSVFLCLPFHDFPQSLHANCWDSASNRPRSILSDFLQFVIHESSYHSAIHRLSYWRHLEVTHKTSTKRPFLRNGFLGLWGFSCLLLAASTTGLRDLHELYLCAWHFVRVIPGLLLFSVTRNRNGVKRLGPTSFLPPSLPQKTNRKPPFNFFQFKYPANIKEPQNIVFPYCFRAICPRLLSPAPTVI